MSKPAVQDDRQNLPAGWQWADWPGRTEAQRFWRNELSPTQRATFHVRFEYFTIGIRSGHIPPKEMGFFFKGGGGCGKVKIVDPSPGWRAWFCRHGDTFFVTHFTIGTTKDKDEAKEETTTRAACTEHKDKHPLPHTASKAAKRKRPPKTPPKKRRKK